MPYCVMVLSIILLLFVFLKTPGELTYCPPEATLKVKEAFDFIDNNALGEITITTRIETTI